MMKPIDGIILAAGLSTRMGDPKLLMELQGSTILERAVKVALESALRTVIVVLGPKGEHVRSALTARMSEERLRFALNPRPSDGMSSSLTAGLAAAGDDAAGAMILLADQPLLTSEVIDGLIAAFCRDADMIVLPVINGRRTTPVIFPAVFFSELMEVTGDRGGRDVIKRHGDSVVQLEMASYYDDSDVDTREDLEYLRAKLTAEPGDVVP